ncbi:helix-turn-helix transcriptional regulator [Desulfuromonas acetoxidans]|uniref:helix-turn-helix domain-containing protein n=1 Tax=Desulfuromonas acetoxidans TaxID=891 RepID=UPI00292E667A|nr:helix-turn-helix transcriptional regulator [Desulfuromonas acetoxidans]
MSNEKSRRDIGLRLKEARNALAMTQTAFSEPLGVRQSHISGIEKGEREPSDTLILLMEYHYGISRTWIKHGEGSMLLDKKHDDINLPQEQQRLLDAYSVAEDSIKYAALTMLENSAEKSQSAKKHK